MGKTFTTSDLIEQVFERTGVASGDIKKVIDSAFVIVEDGLLKGNKYVLRGMVTFEIKERKPRIGKDFATNKPMPIPGRYVPVATISEVLVKKYRKKTTRA